jgi:hypothetical protein
MKKVYEDQFEWDFSQLDLDELEHAHHWEFGREREIWQERTKQFRQEFAQNSKRLLRSHKKYIIPPGDGFDSYFYLFEDTDISREKGDGGVPSTWLVDALLERIKLPDDTFIYSPEWPDAPYLTIKKNEMRRRNALSNHGFLHPGFMNWRPEKKGDGTDPPSPGMREIPLFTEKYHEWIEK